MESAKGQTRGLALVLVRFAKDLEIVKQLATEDGFFRETCEDYAMAHAVLEKIKSGRRSDRDSATVEYASTVVADLESDIATFIRRRREQAGG